MAVITLDYWRIFVLLMTLFELRRVGCLLVVSDIQVPQIVDFRDNVTLSCRYDMSGHTLNSVKWYKDDREFFRYSPLMHPVYMKFPVVGIQLMDDKNFCNESTCRVVLTALGIKSSGVYRCEVSGDAPHFMLTARTANMTVEALPQNNPVISSLNTTYRYDDFVEANCTAAFSSLPAQLSWYINDVRATSTDLQAPLETTIPAHEYNLHRQALQVNFYANDPRFQPETSLAAASSASDGAGIAVAVRGSAGRVLKLRCVAEIAKVPELQRETEFYAILMRDEDLRNQKLVNSRASFALPYPLLVLLLVLSISLFALPNANGLREEVLST